MNNSSDHCEVTFDSEGYQRIMEQEKGNLSDQAETSTVDLEEQENDKDKKRKESSSKNPDDNEDEKLVEDTEDENSGNFVVKSQAGEPDINNVIISDGKNVDEDKPSAELHADTESQDEQHKKDFDAQSPNDIFDEDEDEACAKSVVESLLNSPVKSLVEIRRPLSFLSFIFLWLYHSCLLADVDNGTVDGVLAVCEKLPTNSGTVFGCSHCTLLEYVKGKDRYYVVENSRVEGNLHNMTLRDILYEMGPCYNPLFDSCQHATKRGFMAYMGEKYTSQGLGCTIQ